MFRRGPHTFKVVSQFNILALTLSTPGLVTVTFEVIWISFPGKHVLRNMPLVVWILDWNGITDQASHQQVGPLVGLECDIESV